MSIDNEKMLNNILITLQALNELTKRLRKSCEDNDQGITSNTAQIKANKDAIAKLLGKKFCISLTKDRRAIRFDLAKAALTGLLGAETSEYEFPTPDAVVDSAIKHADAMLARIEKEKET